MWPIWLGPSGVAAIGRGGGRAGGGGAEGGGRGGGGGMAGGGGGGGGGAAGGGPPLSVLHELEPAGNAGAPPGLAPLRKQVDGVVVGVLTAQRQRVLGLHAGPVVLRPVGDAEVGVVPGDLVHPALADVRDVADHPGGSEPGQVAHDLVL